MQLPCFRDEDIRLIEPPVSRAAWRTLAFLLQSVELAKITFC